MRKFLIPAVSLAALSISGLAFAQTTTTEQPTGAQPAVDCVANPADPACPASGAQTQTDDAATGTTTGQSTTTTTDPATGTDTTTTTTTGTDTTGQSTTTTTDPAVTTDPAITTGTTTDPAATVATDGAVKGISKDFLASNFIGKTVYSTARENVGEINDLIVSRDGKVHQVVIGVGGFLGIGEKDVAVPMDSLTMMADENGAQMLSIASTRADLESAPTFDRTAMADPGTMGTTGTATGTGTTTGTTNP